MYLYFQIFLEMYCGNITLFFYRDLNGSVSGRYYISIQTKTAWCLMPLSTIFSDWDIDFV
jgi:hypothetical protein